MLSTGISYTWLLNTWSVANTTEKLKFFYLNGHIKLVAMVLENNAEKKHILQSIPIITHMWEYVYIYTKVHKIILTLIYKKH